MCQNVSQRKGASVMFIDIASLTNWTFANIFSRKEVIHDMSVRLLVKRGVEIEHQTLTDILVLGIGPNILRCPIKLNHILDNFHKTVIGHKMQTE